MSDAYGRRPRSDWSTTTPLEDGAPFALVHLNTVVIPTGESEWSIESTIFNLLDTDYETMLFLDDVNALSSDGSLKYPNNIQGSERSLYISINRSM